MMEFISFIIFIFLFFILIFKNIQLRLKLSSITADLLKSYLEQAIISEKMLEISSNKITEKEISSEAFLKFISDSRDWAYEYIEDVQEKIGKFINDIEPEIKYFDEYGIVGEAHPHYYSMKKISEAYKELKKLIPEDYGRIDT